MLQYRSLREMRIGIQPSTTWSAPTEGILPCKHASDEGTGGLRKLGGLAGTRALEWHSGCSAGRKSRPSRCGPKSEPSPVSRQGGPPKAVKRNSEMALSSRNALIPPKGCRGCSRVPSASGTHRGSFAGSKRPSLSSEARLPLASVQAAPTLEHFF